MSRVSRAQVFSQSDSIFMKIPPKRIRVRVSFIVFRLSPLLKWAHKPLFTLWITACG